MKISEKIRLAKLDKKLDNIQAFLTNHVMTEIKQNRNLINGFQQELILIRGSLQAHTEGFRVLNDRVHRLVEQIRRVKLID
jgi:hypothetical protein